MAKQSPIDIRELDVSACLKILNSKQFEFQELAPLLIPFLAGTLMFGMGDGNSPEEIDDIEQLIACASDDEYEQAAAFCRTMSSKRGPAALGRLIKTDTGVEPDRIAAFRKIGGVIQSDPRWTASMLVFSLMMARKLRDRFSSEDIVSSLKHIDREGLSIEDLINNVNSAQD